MLSTQLRSRYNSQGMLVQEKSAQDVLYGAEHSNSLEKTSVAVPGLAKATEVFQAVEKVCFRREVSRFSQVLLTLSLVSSLVFWTSLMMPISGYLHMAIKYVSVATLTCIVVRFLSCKQDLFLFMALFFHGVGDLVLAHPYQDLLLYSLGPFLLGHIFYIMTFQVDITDLQRIRRNLSRAKKIILSSMFLYSIVMGIILIPGLTNTPFLVPLVVYLLVITCMICCSVIPQYTTRWIVFGCLLYVFSDSLIALDKFYLPLPGPLVHLSWPTYYVGQCMILFGFLKEKNKSKQWFFTSNRLFSF